MATEASSRVLHLWVVRTHTHRSNQTCFAYQRMDENLSYLAFSLSNQIPRAVHDLRSVQTHDTHNLHRPPRNSPFAQLASEGGPESSVERGLAGRARASRGWERMPTVNVVKLMPNGAKSGRSVMKSIQALSRI